MQELSAIASRLETLEGRGRIFRIDKHDVPENEIPEMLRRIQAVRFYREDLDAKNVQEFYWRGKVRLTDEYEGAVYYLTTAICKRLEELGIPLQPQVQRQPTVSLPPSNGRVVFVAKPAGDMVEAYRMLVRVLRDTGYRVTPEPDKELGELEDVRSAVVNGLAEAEASVHLLGKRTGGRPEGLDMDLAPLQLAAAEDEARRRPGFERMIWAPGVLPETSAEPEIVRRDPLEVLAGFGQRPLAMDQINSDTASRFNEFVLQRLERRDGDGEPRYDHVMMARALSQVTGRDVDEFLARMDWRVDPKTGNRVHQDAAGEWPRGSKTYPSFAYENREVARTYDTMMGTVVSVDLL